MIMGLLKSLYPKEVCARLDKLPSQKRKMFDQVNGTRQIWELFYKQPYPAWEMSRVDAVKRAEFLDKRKQYLLYP
jgi:uncharacterized protein YbbC (DUF1343 family)